MRRKLYTNFLQRPAPSGASRCGGTRVCVRRCSCTTARTVLIVADRFLIDGAEVTDLATADRVRLTLRQAGPVDGARERVALCDALAPLRHPLLYPLLDYGVDGERGRRWFEARMALPALPIPARRAPRTALHLVRFLRANGLELPPAAVEASVRPVEHAPVREWRPVGLTLRLRAVVDVVRAVLEAGGPPGVTSIAIHGVEGSGLRTARVLLARAARLAGYVVADRRFERLLMTLAADRHLCVFDWLPAESAMPGALARATAHGCRRHAWIRFDRGPLPAGSRGNAIELQPLTRQELMAMI